MLHVFKINNDDLIYDSVSEALVSCSPEAAAIVKEFDLSTGAPPSQEKVASLKALYGAQFYEELAAELSELKAQQIFFTKEPEVHKEQLYPGGAKIKSMCLHICHDCNLRCRYCFAGQGDYHTGKREFLSLETGKVAVDFLVKAAGPRKNLDIDFFGGEPLMNWPVVVDLVQYIRAVEEKTGKVIRLTITTNALLLNDERIKFINEHFQNVVLSLDGRPEIHNFLRPGANKKDNHAKTLENILRFIELRGEREYYVRGTFTHYNTDFTQDLKYMVESGIQQISLEPVVGDKGADYSLTSENLSAVLIEYEKLAKYYLATKDGQKPYRFFHFILDLEKGPCPYKRRKGCGVGAEYIAVTPQGEIYPCHQLVGEEQFKLGSVFNAVEDLDQEILGEFSELLLPDKDSCADCWAKFYCAGGCAANHYFASGSLQGLAEDACLLQKKRLEAALWLKYQEQVANM